MSSRPICQAINDNNGARCGNNGHEKYNHTYCGKHHKQGDQYLYERFIRNQRERANQLRIERERVEKERMERERMERERVEKYAREGESKYEIEEKYEKENIEQVRERTKRKLENSIDSTTSKRQKIEDNPFIYQQSIITNRQKNIDNRIIEIITITSFF